MDLKKANLEDRMVDVIDFDTLNSNRELYSTGPVGVECEKGDEKYILPYRPNSPINTDRPGVYKLSEKAGIDFIVYPNDRYKRDYQPKVIDFSDVQDMQDLINKREQVRCIEREILTSPDSIFRPQITEDDSPEMRGLKTAIIAKNIDIDKYQDRFGENFPNDKRKMRDNKISLFLLKRNCQCLDMKAELVISDANPNVPNPIGYPIHIDLTGNGTDYNQEDVGEMENESNNAG